MKIFTPLIILVLSSAIAGYGLFKFYPIIDIAQKSSSWPSVNGVITDSERINTTPNVSPSDASYQTNFTYIYSVNGKKYSGSNLYWGWNLSSQKSLVFYISKYKKGSEVQVHYSAANPNNSVIEAGIKSDSLFVPVIVALLLLSAIATSFFFLIKHIKEKNL